MELFSDPIIYLISDLDDPQEPRKKVWPI